jgi:hypothetical protein
MDARWSWEAKAALYCVLLLPLWVWITDLNSNAFWELILCGVLGFGAGFGISGARRGSTTSRRVSAACLLILLVAAVGFVVLTRRAQRLG